MIPGKDQPAGYRVHSSERYIGKKNTNMFVPHMRQASGVKRHETCSVRTKAALELRIVPDEPEVWVAVLILSQILAIARHIFCRRHRHLVSIHARQVDRQNLHWAECRVSARWS